MPLCGSVPGSLLWDDDDNNNNNNSSSSSSSNNNDSNDGPSGFASSAIMKPPICSGMTQAISFSCSCCLDTKRLSEKAWLRNSRGGDERLTAGTVELAMDFSEGSTKGHSPTLALDHHNTKRKVVQEVAYMTEAVSTTYFIN